MAKAADIKTQFNAGELSPLMEGRVDFAKYSNGCRTMENFIPTVQGPAKRRPGSRYVATTKTSGDRIWLRSFVASESEQYVLEFGDRYVRFYTNHGQLQSSPGVAYEVVTPYLIADLTTAEGVCALSFAQSNDVLFIAHGLYPPATLSRTGVGAFVFAQNAVGGDPTGPFKDLNSDQTKYVSASADTGVITLAASTGIFLDGMVGKYFYLQEGIDVKVHQWEPGKGITIGDRRRSDGKNYIAAAPDVAFPDPTFAGTCGSVRPIHDEGTRYDGDAGVKWTFTDDGSGVVLITSLIGAQPTGNCNATVVKRLPFSVTAPAGGTTHRWATAAWQVNDGYPSCVCFFRERLVYARGQTVWTSVAADFLNFAFRDGGQVLSDSAITLTLAADQKDPILWMQPERSLLAGTRAGEWAIAEYTNGQPFGPSNVKAERQSAYGSRQLKPLSIGAANLFLQRGGRVVQEMSYDIRQDAYQSSDISAISEHITKCEGIAPDVRINAYEGILDWTFALRKDRIIWMARSDGQLVGLTYNREQDVVAWHRHKIGDNMNTVGGGYGIVESVCAIASPDGSYDDLWLVVNRVGLGRHIEWVGQPLETNLFNTPWGGGQLFPGPQRLVGFDNAGFRRSGLWELNAFFVDGGLSRFPTLYYNGAAAGDTVTAVSGLGHLEGRTVQVLADGGPHPDRLVAGGAITLQFPAYTVHVGLKAPAILETMQFNSGAQEGTAQGRIKRIAHVTVRLHETATAFIGPDANHLEEMRFRSAATHMDSYVPFFTGDIRVDWPGGYETQARIYIKQSNPLPITVVALMPVLETREQ